MNGFVGRKVKGGRGWSRKELKWTSKSDRPKVKVAIKKNKEEK